jgi:hypothetical protein
MKDHDDCHDDGDDMNETCSCKQDQKNKKEAVNQSSNLVTKNVVGPTYMVGRLKSCQYPHFYYNMMVPHLEQCLSEDR